MRLLYGVGLFLPSVSKCHGGTPYDYEEAIAPSPFLAFKLMRSKVPRPSLNRRADPFIRQEAGTSSHSAIIPSKTPLLRRWPNSKRSTATVEGGEEGVHHLHSTCPQVGLAPSPDRVRNTVPFDLSTSPRTLWPTPGNGG